MSIRSVVGVTTCSLGQTWMDGQNKISSDERTNFCFSSGISVSEYTRCRRERESVCDKECVQNYKRWEHIWCTNTHIQYVCQCVCVWVCAYVFVEDARFFLSHLHTHTLHTHFYTYMRECKSTVPRGCRRREKDHTSKQLLLQVMGGKLTFVEKILKIRDSKILVKKIATWTKKTKKMIFKIIF